MAWLLAFLVSLIGIAPALAQGRTAPAPAAANQPPPVAKPYKPVAIRMPGTEKDTAFLDLRNRLSAAVQKRERAALVPLVATSNFFWLRDGRDAANKRGSGVDILSAALGLASKDAVGWDMIAGYLDDPTTSPAINRPGTLCSPGDPSYDVKAFEAMLKSTGTDMSQWGYPASDNLEVRLQAPGGAPSTTRLGLYFVRVLPERVPTSQYLTRIQLPDGRFGLVAADSIAPLGGDRLCFVKEGGTWKIGGYIGGGEP